MRLRYISIPLLVAAVGGDPWAVNQSLQRGRPAQISSLAQAFYDAGQETAEARATFDEARRRFEAAWNRENGEHPINDSAEVQRATNALGVQAAQLPKIAADLEQIAAVLAEAQRASGGQVALLERRLEHIDRQLGEAHDLENGGHLSMAEGWRLSQVISELEHQAINDTTAALHVVETIRDRYSEFLQRVSRKMRIEEAYDAAPVAALDGYESETPQHAERDVHAALAGDQRAAARVNDVLNSITDEQRAGKVPLEPEQAAVLSQLQAQQYGMSIEALEAAQGRLGDQGQMIPNSWQLMSNPVITFPRTELKPGAQQGTELVKGDVAQLPTSLLPDSFVLNGPMNLFYLERMASIASGGNPKFRTNTGFDALMLAHASTLMHHGISTDEDPVIATIFTLVSPDHQVVHDTLVGPKGKVFLDTITNHAWLDRGKGAAALINWIEGSSQGPEARLAGETARAYGMYIGTHSSELLRLAGGHSIGEVNPDLVRSMAHGLTPYIGNIAGIPGGLVEFGVSPDGLGAIETGQMPIAKGIFSVLSSDQGASDYFNGTAERQALMAEGAYARDFISHAPNLNSYNTDLGHAMTLRGLVDTGIHNAIQAEVRNHQIAEDAAQHAEYDRRKTAYEAGLKTAAAGVGLVPGGFIPGAAISILGGIVEGDVLGAAPTASVRSDYSVPLMSVGRVDREILNAVIASGQHVPIPETYLVNGHVGTPDELAGTISTLTSDEYDHVLSQALVNLFAQNFGSDPTLPVVPDQHMMNRYNAIVTNPVPGPAR